MDVSKQNKCNDEMVIVQRTDCSVAAKQAANKQGLRPSVAKQVTKKIVKVNVEPPRTMTTWPISRTSVSSSC